MSEVAASKEVQQIAEKYNKPLWNTEEHIYKKGFDCEISLVQAYNDNYIRSGHTKVVNWYLSGSVYPIEPYPEDPAAIIANSPWSGHYAPREVLWGYAHYGQFVKTGWQYLNGGCLMLAGGGSVVTMKSPGDNADYSIIAETKNAKEPQTLNFKASDGLSTKTLCVWRSNAKEQFVQQADVSPKDGSFDISLDPSSIYSISTTRGQQKGSFADVPAAKAFPFPYHDDFESYRTARDCGYLPRYFADIVGVFELADRPDGKGKCLRQVVDKKPQSWAPEWAPYTIFGDAAWTDYEVSADIYLDNGGWAGVMGRVINVGTGFGTNPKGYYLRLAEDGNWALCLATSPPAGARGRGRGAPASSSLKTGKVDNMAGNQWHNVRLQFVGTTIKAFIDRNDVASVTDSTIPAGMAGLVTGDTGNTRNSALFDNVVINSPNGKAPTPAEFPAQVKPIYAR
jgi:galactosylceramidase